MSVFDRPNARREAELFLAELVGGARPRPRRAPQTAPAPPPDSAGRLFDRVVHGADAAFAGEALDAAFEPVAMPGSRTPVDDLRPGDLVVQRALGEGWLGALRVLGEDVAVAELYDRDGWIRRDMLVLRAPGREARARPPRPPREDHDDDEPVLPADPPSEPTAGGKLYRVISDRGGATAVYVPDGARATDPAALIVWLHGDLTCGDEGPDAVSLVKSKTFPFVQQLSDSGRPYVLVAPTMGWGEQASHALGTPEAMNAFLEEVRGGLRNAGWTSTPALGPVILAGHARAHAVLDPLVASVRDAAWSRAALAAVGEVWLLDTTVTRTNAQRDCDNWTAFARARPDVRLRVFYRRGGAAERVAECIRAAATASALRNVTVADADPGASSPCELPRRHLPQLLRELPATSPSPAADRGSVPSMELPRPSIPTTAFRRWYLTAYRVATEPETSGGPRVAVLTSTGSVIANVPAGLFAEMARHGRARLRDGRLVTGDGWRSPAGHDYASVLAVHRRRYPERHRDHNTTRVSGIEVVGGEVKTVRAYAVVPPARAGKGYGVLYGIPLEPFRTIAADIGAFETSDPRYRGAWSASKQRHVVVPGSTGLVPTGTRVYIRQLDGAALPDGTRHDGWMVVNDTGRGVHGARFEVFVGDERSAQLSRALAGGRFVDIWFDGIEARVPAGYADGLPRR